MGHLDEIVIASMNEKCWYLASWCESHWVEIRGDIKSSGQLSDLSRDTHHQELHEFRRDTELICCDMVYDIPK